jgi:hypothetical protein
MRRTFGWWLLLLGIAASCREPARNPRDGGEEPPICEADAGTPECDDASSDSVMFTWAKGVCDLLLDCCSTSERLRVAQQFLGADGLALLTLREPALLVDPIACRRGIAFSFFGRYANNYDALDAQRQRFDLTQARACVQWAQLGATHCAPGLVLRTEAQQPEACGKMFAPNVEADGGCYDDGDCLATPDGGRSICEGDTGLLDDGGVRVSVAGHCRPLPGVGEDCPLPGSVCGDGLYCSFDFRCHQRVGLGGVCVAAPCDESTFCDTARQPATCSRRRSYFEPCTSDAVCVKGATCDPTLQICIDPPKIDPLDLQFDFCLGTQGNAVARQLPFVPSDGGL